MFLVISLMAATFLSIAGCTPKADSDAARQDSAAAEASGGDHSVEITPPSAQEKPVLTETEDVGASDSEGDQAFWKVFRAAALSDNIERVKVLTQFPFTTSGAASSFEKESHDRSDFAALFAKLMKQSLPRGEGETTSPSMRDVLQQTSNLDDVDLRSPGHSFQVENFVFHSVDGKWRFVHAHTSEQ